MLGQESPELIFSAGNSKITENSIAVSKSGFGYQPGKTS